MKSIINGLGEVPSSLYLYNGEYWEINNIEVTNTDGTSSDQGILKGIHVVAENTGAISNIIIKNCYIHNVNGHVGGKRHGGIQVRILGESIGAKFHKLLIENNVAAASSCYDTGHSIVNFNTINCVLQYNEAYGNTGDSDENERGGFDADYKSTGTIIQYNYSHDNNWFCGIMRRGINADITIRYNISQNELLGCYLYGFPTEDGLKDVKVYNNVHYFGKGKGNTIFVEGGKVRRPIETTFKNNIFYFEDEAEWGFEPESSCVFENNLFFNVSPKGKNAITSNPMFVNPGKGETNIDMRNPSSLLGYRLKDNAPGLESGVKIENNGGEDFIGNRLYQGSPEVGAFEN